MGSISMLECSPPHGADCYALHLHRIMMGPSGYLLLPPPADPFRLIMSLAPVSTSLSLPSLPREKEDLGRESLWPISVCAGCVSGVRW